MKSSMNLAFGRGDYPTYFAVLSHNDERELFFTFLWDRIKPSSFYDGVSQRERKIANLAHVSFHKDGSIHWRIKTASNKKDRIADKKLKAAVTSMPQDQYAPLLILSLYNLDELRTHIGKSSPLPQDGFSDFPYCWDVGNTNEFSLVFFLVGSDVNYKLMLEAHFPGIFTAQQSPMIYNYFGDEDKVVIQDGKVTAVHDYGLLIGYSKKAIPVPPEEVLTGPAKVGHFEMIRHVFGATLTPTDDMILRRLG